MNRQSCLWLVTCAALAGCGGADDPDNVVAALSGAARRPRSERIRDVAAASGLTNGVLLGGIGQVETGLSHCWSEATWACQGPYSSFCGGPVIAGSSDGSCSARQGGLGLFQFDGGNYDQTLARDGRDILELDGNIRHGVDFIAQLVREEIAGVGTRTQAIAWLNAIHVVGGDPTFERWNAILACRYNGRCGSVSQAQKYRDATLGMLSEFGAAFWRTGQPTTPPTPPASSTTYNVDTFAAAPGYSTPGGFGTGTLNAGTSYVYCRVLGPVVQNGGSYNHWWLRTDLDSGSPSRGQYVSAYYLSRWGNDIAKDNSGREIADCAPTTTKYYVDTGSAAPGFSAPGGSRTGTLNAGTNYVFCRAWGPAVQVGSSYNHWWLKTDLDSGSPAQGQFVSAYYLSRWGNDVAKDNGGQDIPGC